MPNNNINEQMADYSNAPLNSDAGAYYDPPKKRGAGFYIGIAIAAIAMVAALVIGSFLFLNSTQIVGKHRSGMMGDLDRMTKEEIQAELNKIAQDGMFSIAISNVIALANGSSEGEFNIENPPTNKYNMEVQLVRKDNGNVIYKSGILEPNYHIQYARLDEPLPAGTYECIAQFNALNPDDDKVVGQASAQVTVVVRS